MLFSLLWTIDELTAEAVSKIYELRLLGKCSGYSLSPSIFHQVLQMLYLGAIFTVFLCCKVFFERFEITNDNASDSSAPES